jgi:hypothetical protein
MFGQFRTKPSSVLPLGRFSPSWFPGTAKINDMSQRDKDDFIKAMNAALPKL